MVTRARKSSQASKTAKNKKPRGSWGGGGKEVFIYTPIKLCGVFFVHLKVKQLRWWVESTQTLKKGREEEQMALNTQFASC